MHNNERIQGSAIALNHMFRWQLGSSLYLTLLQIAGIVFLGRFLGYLEMGIYAIFQLIFRLAVALFEPGMFVSIIQKRSWSKSLLHLLNKWQLMLACGGLFVMVIFFAIEQKYYHANPWIVFTGLFLFMLIAWGSRYTAILTRQLHQRQISLAQIAGASLEFLFLLSFIWFFDPMWVFPLGLLLRFVAYYAICYYFTNNEVNDIPESSESEEYGVHLKFSSYQLINQGLSFVQGNFDTVLILAVFGLQTLGPYNFASELSYLLFSKLNPIFNKVVFPVLSRHQEDAAERQYIISESMLSHALVCLGLYLLLFFHLPEVVGLIFKDEEGQILIFSRFICIMAMIRSVNNLAFSQLLALGASRQLLQWNIAVLLFNYAFIFVIYLTQSPIQTFLEINIFVSLFVLVFTIYKLFYYYSNVSSGYREIIYFMVYYLIATLVFYGISLLQLYLVISIALCIVCLLILSLVFYRAKVMRLIHLRIL